MSTRSSARRLLSPIEGPERLLSRQNQSEPSLLFDLEEDDMTGQVPPQGPSPDLRKMEELLKAPTDGAVKLNNVPGDVVKLLLFLFSLKGAARTWLEKEPPNSITTWNDIIDTFYNSLNQSEQDSLNSAAGGNFLTKNTQEALTIIENKSKVQTSQNKPQASSASGSSTQDAHVTALTKQVEALLSSMNRPVNSIQNGCETCGGPHAYYECQAAGGYTQEDVYATTGTSGLNSHDESSGKERQSGDFVDPDRLHESQTIVVPKIIMTKHTRPDQRGSTRVDSVLITPDESPTLEATPRVNPKLTSCTSGASKHPSDALAQNLNLKALQEKVEKQQRKMDKFIANKVPTVVKELVYAQVNTQVKNHASILQITLTSSSALSTTNITIPQWEETLYEMITNNPYFIIGDINTDLYIALSKSIKQDKQVVPKDSRKKANLMKRTHDDQDPPENHEGEKRYKKSRFAGQSSSRKDQAMPDASDHDMSDAKDRFNEVVDTYLDLDELEDGEILPNNSTLTLAKGLKGVSNKAEYDYNMDKMTIAMSNDMDWELDHGLGVDSKEPLSLFGPELSQRIPL
ncbi:hypothetical protein Tco_0904433 [Tanacetum coccineum]